MERIRKVATWYYLLNKRLLKKRSFLILLLLVPLLVFGMRMIAKQDSGVITIMLCKGETEDKVSEEVVNKLLSSKSVIQYVTTNSKEEAYEAVKSGKVDGAWIFAENMQEQIDKFAESSVKHGGIVTVVEREDNVFLQLAREKLYGELYDYVSFAIYKQYVTTNLGIEEKITEEEFLSAYEEKEIKEEIFEFSYLDPEEKIDDAVSMHYLLAPVRGLLVLMVVLVGLASALYYEQDKREGNFARMPVKYRLWFEYGYHLIAITDCAIVVLAALYVSGTFLSIGKEVLFMFLYCMMCAGFVHLVRRLCGTAQRLAACIPILMIAMLVLCPVFFNVQGLQPLQYLLPPFYYLQGLHNGTFLYQMLIYSVVAFVLGKVLPKEA